MKRLLKALTEYGTAKETAAAHEEVFGSPLPQASDEDVSLGRTLAAATFDLLQTCGRQVKGPGCVRGKFTTPDGVAITLSIITPTATNQFVKARITAKHDGDNVLTVQLRQQDGDDEELFLSTSYTVGAWIKPYLAYWRTACPTHEGTPEDNNNA